MTTIMAGTAIRESELLALNWADFDWHKRVISNRRSPDRGNIDITKSKKGFRDIPFGWYVGCAALSLRSRVHNGGKSLTERGKICSPRVVERLGFAPVIKRLRLGPFTWRSFRCSGATVLHLNNVPLKLQQVIMGHANANMSLLSTGAELTFRRNAINLLEQTGFGVQNQNSTDANGRELELRAVPVAPTH